MVPAPWERRAAAAGADVEKTPKDLPKDVGVPPIPSRYSGSGSDLRLSRRQ